MTGFVGRDDGSVCRVKGYWDGPAENLLGLVEGWKVADVATGEESSDVEGEVAWSQEPHDPHFVWVRSNMDVASGGRSTCHLFADMSRIRRVRRAQSQPSAISSRFLRPCMTSLWAFLSGRLRRWIVHAV